MKKLVTLFLAFGISTLLYADKSQDEALFVCKITKINKRTLESNPDDLKLEVHLEGADHPQPLTYVRVLKTSKGKLALELGERKYTGAEKYDVPPDAHVAFIVESGDVEIGYKVEIASFGDQQGWLDLYTTDLREGERIESRAEQLAQLDCKR